MKSSKIVLSILLPVLVYAYTGQAQNKYTGTKLCATCHKSGKGGTAFVVWEKSGHAKAFEALKSDAAKKIAKEKGLSKPPHESPECLKCHVTGGGSAKNVEATFKMEDGVGCEACHGAASAYKMLHSKGDVAKSKEAGLMEGDKTGKECMVCHNEGSPTFKGFDFKVMWAKIEHTLPPKK